MTSAGLWAAPRGNIPYLYELTGAPMSALSRPPSRMGENAVCRAGGAYTPQRSKLPLSSTSRFEQPQTPWNGTLEPEAGGRIAFRPLLVASRMTLDSRERGSFRPVILNGPPRPWLNRRELGWVAPQC